MKQHRVKISAIITALLVIAAGVLLFLFTNGILPAAYQPIVFSWQSLLIAIGFICLFSRNKWLSGIFLIIIGGAFLIKKMNITSLDFSIQNGLAIGLIVGGIIVLYRVIRRRAFGHRDFHDNIPCFQRDETNKKEELRNKWRRFADDEPGYIDRNFVFGGSKEKLDMQDFKGGEINCVFGGVTLDLTDSQLAEGIHTLEINTVMGGVVLYVPSLWRIELRQNNVFGQFMDKRPKPAFDVEENRVLIIKVSSVFGGGEIKSKNE